MTYPYCRQHPRHFVPCKDSPSVGRVLRRRRSADAGNQCLNSCLSWRVQTTAADWARGFSAECPQLVGVGEVGGKLVEALAMFLSIKVQTHISELIE